MSSLIKVVFTKPTIRRETDKHYEIGDVDWIPPYLFERWSRNRIVQEYKGDEKKLTPSEAYDKMSIKKLQAEAGKLGIDYKGKNKKQLLALISRKEFYFPRSESMTTIDNIAENITEAEDLEGLDAETFELTDEEKGEN